jgi:hypothetical protein
MTKENVFRQLWSLRGNCVKIEMRDGSTESMVVPRNYEFGVMESESKDGKEVLWLRIWNNELQFTLENIMSITKRALLRDIDLNRRLAKEQLHLA